MYVAISGSEGFYLGRIDDIHQRLTRLQDLYRAERAFYKKQEKDKRRLKEKIRLANRQAKFDIKYDSYIREGKDMFFAYTKALYGHMVKQMYNRENVLFKRIKNQESFTGGEYSLPTVTLGTPNEQYSRTYKLVVTVL